MFSCTCGGIMLVKDIEPYPEGMASSEKLKYVRTCIVECSECKKVLEGQKYD